MKLLQIHQKLWTLLCITVCFVSGTSAQIQKEAYNPVVAHRGAWKAKGLPENSVASLQEAIRLGCAGSEFDVRMTADDSLIINHDEAYHGNTIEKTNYAQLVSIPLANGEKIPTLREYIIAGLQNNSQTMLVIEIKPSGISTQRAEQAAEKAVSLVHLLNAEKKVCYISFDFHILEKIRSLDTTAILQYLEGDKSPATLQQAGINGADFHFSVYEEHPDWIKDALKLNMLLNVWTVNEKEQLQQFVNRHFNYITTNEPGLLLDILRKNDLH